MRCGLDAKNSGRVQWQGLVNRGISLRVTEAAIISEPLATSHLFHEISEILSISAGLKIFRRF